MHFQIQKTDWDGTEFYGVGTNMKKALAHAIKLRHSKRKVKLTLCHRGHSGKLQHIAEFKLNGEIVQ